MYLITSYMKILYNNGFFLQSKIVYYNGNNFTNKKLDDNRILCDLSPYTEYTFSVSGQLMIEKERDNQTLIPKGYWSSPVVITARTNSDGI